MGLDGLLKLSQWFVQPASSLMTWAVLLPVPVRLLIMMTTDNDLSINFVYERNNFTESGLNGFEKCLGKRIESLITAKIQCLMSLPLWKHHNFAYRMMESFDLVVIFFIKYFCRSGTIEFLDRITFYKKYIWKKQVNAMTDLFLSLYVMWVWQCQFSFV